MILSLILAATVTDNGGLAATHAPTPAAKPATPASPAPAPSPTLPPDVFAPPDPHLACQASIRDYATTVQILTAKVKDLEAERDRLRAASKPEPPKAPAPAPPKAGPPAEVAGPPADQAGPLKQWHTDAYGRKVYGWLGDDGLIHYEPSEQGQACGPQGCPPAQRRGLFGRRPKVKWFVRESQTSLDDKGKPIYTMADVQKALRESAKHWSVADVEIVPAASEADANLVVWAEPMDMTWGGWTTIGGPQFLLGGGKAHMRLNAGGVGKAGLLTVVMHELGHALGLNHAPTTMGTSIMHPASLASGLDAADVIEITKLYGAADR